jgi:hypothetical protein
VRGVSSVGCRGARATVGALRSSEPRCEQNVHGEEQRSQKRPV